MSSRSAKVLEQVPVGRQSDFTSIRGVKTIAMPGFGQPRKETASACWEQVLKDWITRKALS